MRARAEQADFHIFPSGEGSCPRTFRSRGTNLKILLHIEKYVVFYVYYYINNPCFLPTIINLSGHAIIAIHDVSISDFLPSTVATAGESPTTPGTTFPRITRPPTRPASSRARRGPSERSTAATRVSGIQGPREVGPTTTMWTNLWVVSRTCALRLLVQ